MRWRTAAAVWLVLGLAGLGAARAQEKQPAEKAQPATLRIKMPMANATLTINGVQTQQTGVERKFVTPPLEADGKNKYFYTVVAFWEPNNYTKITRTREIEVVPGKEIDLDLNEADPKFQDNVVVRYVPTPPEVVEAMLKLAKVGKDDVVYDLGCGDGRMVIAAVKAGAKKGIGIDLDPQRLKECAENAKASGVEDRLTFRQGDVLKVEDLSDATVVMLYMGNELNIRLRPILWQKLKPGTRIVSHRFTMGDWKPEQTETLTVRGEKFLIHLWTITGKEKEKEGEK